MWQLRFDIPPALWLSANDRWHWARKAYRVSGLRKLSFYTALYRRLPKDLSRVCIEARIGYRTRGRADPANAAPTVKALIDGLVDYGMIPDDDSEHLPSVAFTRDLLPATGLLKGHHAVTLVITRTN